MPVFKYKSFEEAERALWNFNPDKKYLKQVSDLFELANRLNPIKYPRGIFKFKTIEEANRHREEIELAHAREVQRKRREVKEKQDKP